MRERAQFRLHPVGMDGMRGVQTFKYVQRIKGKRGTHNRRRLAHLLAPAFSKLKGFETVGNQPIHVELPQARRRPTSDVIFTLSINRFSGDQVLPYTRFFFRVTSFGVVKADLCRGDIRRAYEVTDGVHKPWHSSREVGKRPFLRWHLSTTAGVWNAPHQGCT